MAAAEGQIPYEMTFQVMIEHLLNMSKSVTNDERQNNYCQYVNTFLSHFGSERCMLVGSTQEETRLRTRQDNGDYDYLIISEIVIPMECLINVDEDPLFVHINGTTLQDKFPDLELVDGVYLPSTLLSECRPEAFKQSRSILKIITSANSSHRGETISLHLHKKIKPGTTIVSYEEVECPELEVSQSELEKDVPNKILKQFEDGIEQTSAQDLNMVFGKLIDVLKGLRQLYDKSNVPWIYHAYGSIIDELAGDISELPVNRIVNKGNISPFKSNVLPNIENVFPAKQTCKALIQSPGSVSEASRTAIRDNKISKTLLSKQSNSNEIKCTRDCHVLCELVQQCKPTHTTTHRSSESSSTLLSNDTEVDRTPDMTVKYFKESHKDFIPAFPLSGKPKFLKEWKNRDRHWPQKEIVEDIYNSQFFVVAKPAIINRNKLKDFCLSYNIAEIKIAKAMTDVQRKVVLILKAFQKSILQKYSGDLTAFHWKNVVYWVSESWNPSLFVDTEETVLLFLQDVLERMTDCLCKQELQHYFIPSNLFAGMEAEKAFQIVSKIVKIQEDPIEALRQFFVQQVLDQPKYEVVTGKSVQDFKTSYLDPFSEQYKTMQLTSVIEAFSAMEKEGEHLNEALVDVALKFLPYLNEESERDEDTEDIERKAADRASLDDILNSLYTYLTIPKTERRRMKEAREQLIRDILPMYQEEEISDI